MAIQPATTFHSGFPLFPVGSSVVINSIRTDMLQNDESTARPTDGCQHPVGHIGHANFAPSSSSFHAYAALRDKHGPLFGQIFTQWNLNGRDKGITV